MRFSLTLNMPSRGKVYQNGPPIQNLVHQVIAEHDSESLEQFVDTLSRADFIIVDEYYRDVDTGNHKYSGQLAINPAFVGKIKVYT
jgi:hypothetical protein